MSKVQDIQQTIKTLVGSNPSPAQKKSYYLSFAIKLYEAGEKEEAKSYLEEYLAIKTQEVKGYNLLGQVNEELNNPHDAIKAYNRSLTIDDTQIRLMLKLSTLYLQVKNIAEANFWLDRAETKANKDEKAEIIQNRIEILKLSSDKKVFEQASEGLVHYPKHLGINIQYLEALEARESYFSIFQHFEKCNRYFETNIRWWEWGLHFLARLIQKLKDRQSSDAMDDDSSDEQTVQMHEIVLAWLHFADRYTKLFIDLNFYTMSMEKCKEFEDLVRSARENPPAQLDEDDAHYWNYAVEEYESRVDQHYGSAFIREAGQTTSSEEQTKAIREAFNRLNRCFNNFPAESKMSTLQRRSEVGKQLWSLVNMHTALLDPDRVASLDLKNLLNSTKTIDLQILTSAPEYADNIESVARVCRFYNENKLHNVIEEIFNALFGNDVPKIDINIYREMGSPHVIDFMTYFYMTLLTPVTNVNDPLWRDARKAIRILSEKTPNKKKLDAPWSKHDDLPSITGIAHWIDKIRLGPGDNASLYFLVKLYSDRCIEPANELQKEFAAVYEKYTINLGKKLVKQLRQLLETRVTNSIVQSDKQAMLDDTRTVLETLAKQALKINDHAKAMACVNNLGTSSSYLLLIELSLSQFHSSQRKEFLQRAEQYLKRSSDFSFTKEDERKKLEQLRNEVNALHGDPMDLENTTVSSLTPVTPSSKGYDTQPYISPAVDMTPTASVRKRREQQLSDLKKLRSEALHLGISTPTTPSTPSMPKMAPKNHVSPPPARKLDFTEQVSTPETKPVIPEKSNLIVSINLGNNNNNNAAAKPVTFPIQPKFITTPTVPVGNAPPQKLSVPTVPATVKLNVPIPPASEVRDSDEDSNDENKPRKKRQLSDTDLDPQKKASLISATTKFPPIPAQIVSPNAVPKASPTKPNRSKVQSGASGFDFAFGAPPSSTSATTASPFGFGAPTDTKSSTPSPFGFGPATETKPGSAPSFGFGDSPFSFGAPTTPAADKPKDKAEDKSSTATPFTFGPGAPQAANNNTGNKPADKTDASPFSFGFGNSAASNEPKKSSTTLVDNNSPFNFGAKSQLDSSVKSEMSASELMKSDKSVDSAGWRDERGSHFGSERNELFKATIMSPSSSQRSEDQDEKSRDTDEEYDEEDEEEEDYEHEDSEESVHSDDSEGWITGPTPKSNKPADASNAPQTTNMPVEAPKTAAPSFGFGEPAKENNNKPATSGEFKFDASATPFAFGTKSTEAKDDKSAPKTDVSFGFGATTPSFGFGFGQPAAGDKEKPKTDNTPVPPSGFGVTSGQPNESKEMKDDKPTDETSKSDSKSTFNFAGFGATPSFGFGATTTEQAKEGKDDGKKPTDNVPTATPSFGFGFGGEKSLEKKDEEKPEKDNVAKSEPGDTPSFGFGFGGTPATPSFGFGSAATEKLKEEKTEAEKPKGTNAIPVPTPSFGFGFGGTSVTPSFGFGTAPSDKPAEEKKSDSAATGFGFGFGAPSFSFGQSNSTSSSGVKEEPKQSEEATESKLDQSEKAESVTGSVEAKAETIEPNTNAVEKKPEAVPSFGFGTATPFAFGQTKPEEKTSDKSDENKPKEDITKAIEAPFSFNLTQPVSEPKVNQSSSPPSQSTEGNAFTGFGIPALGLGAVSEQPKDEKIHSPSATKPAFGFGFGTIPVTPSFGFGTSPTKPDTPKGEKEGELGTPEKIKSDVGRSSPLSFESFTPKLDPEEPTEEPPKFDLSALGSATFKFGQQNEEEASDEENSEEEPAKIPSNFTFSFGGNNLFDKDKASENKPSKHLQDPMRPIPNDSDDDDSYSDSDEDDKPSKSTALPSSSSFNLAAPSFAFAPSSFSVPTSDKPSEEEKPKFEFTIQFGEASMTKRLGSDFGLTDDKKMMPSSNNNNNTVMGSGFSSDKIFGQASTSPLTTFSTFAKSDEKKSDEEKKPEEVAKTDDKLEEAQKPTSEVETKSDASAEEKTTDSVNTTIEASHEETSDPESGTDSDDEHEDESHVTDTIDEQHKATLTHFQRAAGPKNRRRPSHTPAVERHGEEKDANSAEETVTAQEETKSEDKPEDTQEAPVERSKPGFGFALPGMAPGVDLRSVLKKMNQPKEEVKDTTAEVETKVTDEAHTSDVSDKHEELNEEKVVEEKPLQAEERTSNNNSEQSDEPKDQQTDENTSAPQTEETKQTNTEEKNEQQVNENTDNASDGDHGELKDEQTGENVSQIEESTAESVPSDVPSLVSDDSQIVESTHQNTVDSVRSDEIQSELSASVLEGSNMSVESTGWTQAERGSHFGSEHDNPLFASTIMSSPGSMTSSQVDEHKEGEHGDKPVASESKIDQGEPVTENQAEGHETPEHSNEDPGDLNEKENESVKPEDTETNTDGPANETHTSAVEQQLQSVEVKQDNTDSDEKKDPVGAQTPLGFGFGSGAPLTNSPFSFGSPSFNFGTATETQKADTSKEETAEKPSPKLSFDFGGFGSSSEPKEEKTEAEKPNETNTIPVPTPSFGFGFGGTSVTPSFGFGTAPSDKPAEEKKSDSAATGFGFGFGAPSFSFGQSNSTSSSGVKEEPKQSEEATESKLDQPEKADEKKFDLSALGAATFKFGQQSEDKNTETAVPATPAFNFGFGSSLGGTMAQQQPRQVTPEKSKKSHNPIPIDSDDESDSDDDRPSNSNTASNLSAPSFNFAAPSFAFAPSSFSVPTSDKPSEEEKPKFEFTIQFGEASMTKRLGSDFGLTDDKKMMPSSNNNNNTAMGSGFSSDKIFGQASGSSLATFSTLAKSNDNDNETEEKKDEQT